MSHVHFQSGKRPVYQELSGEVTRFFREKGIRKTGDDRLHNKAIFIGYLEYHPNQDGGLATSRNVDSLICPIQMRAYRRAAMRLTWNSAELWQPNHTRPMSTAGTTGNAG